MCAGDGDGIGSSRHPCQAKEACRRQKNASHGEFSSEQACAPATPPRLDSSLCADTTCLRCPHANATLGEILCDNPTMRSCYRGPINCSVAPRSAACADFEDKYQRSDKEIANTKVTN